MSQPIPVKPALDVSRLIDDQHIGRFAYVLIFSTWLVMLTDGYDLSALAYAGPSLVRDWHIGIEALGPVFGANIFGIMIGSILFGYLGDRIGRKRAILLGAYWYGSATLATVWATGLEHLLWLRFAAGIGIGGAVPNAFVLVSEFAPRRLRATWVTVMFTGYTLGTGIGGVVAASLVPNHGWQVVFVIGGLAPLLVGTSISVTMPESLRFQVLNKWPFKGIVATARRVRPEVAIPVDATFKISDERPFRRFSMGLLFAGHLRYTTLLLWAAFIANSMALFFLQNWLPILIETAGVVSRQAAMMASLFSVGSTAGGLVIMRLIDRRGTQLITFLPLLGFALVAALGMRVDEYLLSTAILGVGFCVAGTHAGLNALASMVYPTSFRSKGAGIAIGIAKIGSISGPMIGGALISAHISLPDLFRIASIPVLIVASLSFLLGRVYRPVEGTSQHRGGNDSTNSGAAFLDNLA